MNVAHVNKLAFFCLVNLSVASLITRALAGKLRVCKRKIFFFPLLQFSYIVKRVHAPQTDTDTRVFHTYTLPSRMDNYQIPDNVS